jgi:beta-glucosidase
LIVSGVGAGAQVQVTPDPDTRVSALLEQMTLEEKVGQMCQFVGIEHLKEGMKRRGKVPSNDDAIGMYPSLTFTEIEQMVRNGRIGSFLHVFTAEEANRLQGWAQESRLKIPLIIGIDAIHGDAMVRGATVYPAPLSLACTFDDDLVERIAAQTAVEVRANGAHWTFSPTLDVARDPRWGRVGETFGEDPYLVGQLGVAMVRGYQGPQNEFGPDRVLSCIKHLIAGSEPVNGLNASPMDVSERTLRTVFLAPYLVSSQAGAGSLMTAHNELNGLPCHANRWIIEDLMRSEGGFDGFVVSDWMDIERLVTLHRVAATQKEAVYQTVMAGMDMHMHGPGFLEPLVELVREGRIPESRVDTSARRILKAKARLGLFDEWRAPEAMAAQVNFNPEHRETALEAARKGIVLLKNEGPVLPLDSDRFKRILVTGPLADTHALLGDWVLAQPPENVITPLEGLQQIAPEGCEVVFFDCGSSAKKTAPSAIREAAAQASEADVTLLVVGDNPLRYQRKDKTSGENMARSDIELPGDQLELVQAVVASGKPVVVIMIGSRPLGSEWTIDHASAVLAAFEPGGQGGQALAEILFGEVNPSGRLPVTIPRSAGHIQTIYNHMPSQYFHSYVLGKTHPLFWFGHGLSYTTFEYRNLRVPKTISPGEPVRVAVDVVNTGSRAGEDIVLVYLNDVVSSTTTPIRELKAHDRVALEPGESTTVDMQIDYDQLALLNAAMEWVVEPGEFEVMVGKRKAVFEVRP